MSAANRAWDGSRRRCAIALLAILLLPPASVNAQEADAGDGLFVSIRYPLDDKEVGRINQVTNQAHKSYRDRLQAAGLGDGAKPLKVVYDFHAEGPVSGSSRYGNCRELAEYLLSRTEITTIAFVHGELTRHAVLPALACQELVMSDDAKIGDAIRDQQEPLGDDQLLFYRKVAEKRGRSPALILKMLDKNLEVYQATRNLGVWFVDGNQQPEPGLIVNRAVGPMIPKGATALFTANEALKYELCKLRDRKSVV